MKANREFTEIEANEANDVRSQVRYLDVFVRKDDPCMKLVLVDPTIQLKDISGKKYLYLVRLRITDGSNKFV